MRWALQNAQGTQEQGFPERTALAYLFKESYLKGPSADIVSSPTERWVAIKIACKAKKLAMGLCHPESPCAGDSRLIAPLFRRLENAYEFMVPSNPKRLADFGPTPPLSQMYLLLKTVYPRHHSVALFAYDYDHQNVQIELWPTPSFSWPAPSRRISLNAAPAIISRLPKTAPTNVSRSPPPARSTPSRPPRRRTP